MCYVSFLYTFNSIILEIMVILLILGILLVSAFIWHYIIVKKAKKRKEAIKRCPYLNGTLDGEKRI